MILVTGGLGFIGTNLCRLLMDNGHKVRVLDNGCNSAVCSTDPSMEGIEVVWDDVRGHGSGVWRDVDIVIHLAAITGVADCEKDTQEAWAVNKRGTSFMLQRARVHNVQQFIFASSVGAVLGIQEQPARENQAPNPISIYGDMKRVAESMVLGGKDQLNTCVLRFTNVYGEHSHRKTNIIPKLMRHNMDEPFTVYGDGSQVRDFVYVGDVCNAVLKTVERKATGVYHIGSGEGTTIQQLLDEIGKVRDRPLKIEFVRERRGDVRENVASIESAKSCLKWEPTTTLHEGLERTYHWFLTA